MKRLLMIVLASSVSVPALAQHEGHASAPAQQTQQQDEPAAADPHAGHNMPAPAPSPASEEQEGPAEADPHAGHTMPASEERAAPPAPDVAADPRAGHVMPAPPEEPAAADPHAGHAMPAQGAPAAADPHAGHNMAPAQAAAPTPPAGPPPAEAFSGPAHGADVFYDQTAMAEARGDMIREHGALPAYRFLIDQLEARIHDGADGYAWDAEAWYGGDINKLWVTSEGEGTFGESVENAEVQALWSRAIDPWFDLQVGVRQDFRSGPDRTHLVAGVQGLAPYWFEVEAMAFVSNKGDVSARFEGEYDLRLTRALILQPRVEFDLALQDSPEIRVGSGLSTAEIGARLRYELFPSSGPAVIAPYIGVQYERAFGQTARYYRAAGDEVGGWSVLAGLRTWF